MSEHAAAYWAGRVKQYLGKSGVLQDPSLAGSECWSWGGGRREKAFSEESSVTALLDETTLLDNLGLCTYLYAG